MRRGELIDAGVEDGDDPGDRRIPFYKLCGIVMHMVRLGDVHFQIQKSE